MCYSCEIDKACVTHVRETNHVLLMCVEREGGGGRWREANVREREGERGWGEKEREMNG